MWQVYVVLYPKLNIYLLILTVLIISKKYNSLRYCSAQEIPEGYVIASPEQCANFLKGRPDYVAAMRGILGNFLPLATLKNLESTH